MDIANYLFSSPWYWLIAGTLLIICEALLPGFLLLWVGCGAIAVGVMVFLWPAAPFALQLVMLAVFMLVAVLLGIKFQHNSKKAKNPNLINAGLASYIGRKVNITEDFIAGTGRLRLDDSYYTATSSDTIQAGDNVSIIDIQNGVFHVAK